MKRIHTWHVESFCIALVIVAATGLGAGSALVDMIRNGGHFEWAMLTPWLAAVGRWVSWGAMSIGNRLAERAAVKARWAREAGLPDLEREVECARSLVGHVVVAQLLGSAAQLASGSLDGLLIGLVFALYVPIWRKRVWRVWFPYAPRRSAPWHARRRRLADV